MCDGAAMTEQENHAAVIAAFERAVVVARLRLRLDPHASVFVDDVRDDQGMTTTIAVATKD
jgi:hypothetical protein